MLIPMVKVNKPEPQKHESYEYVRNLVDGGQGKVCVVKRKSDRKLLVRKEQRKYSTFGSEPYEIYLLKKVLTHHPRIVELESGSYIRSNNSLVLFFEYCHGGDLQDYMPRAGEHGASESFMWDCFVQLADALAFLHYGYDRFAKDPNTPPRGWARVIHRDIKPANVFLRRNMTSNDPVPDVVLGDFGLATLYSESSGAGTPEWIAPEIPLTTKRGDVWGVGAVIHALAHGRGPVPSPPKDWPRGREGREDWYAFPPARQPKQLPTNYSSALNRNMMDCLVKDPEKRVDSLKLVKNLKAERPRIRRRK